MLSFIFHIQRISIDLANNFLLSNNNRGRRIFHEEAFSERAERVGVKKGKKKEKEEGLLFVSRRGVIKISYWKTGIKGGQWPFRKLHGVYSVFFFLREIIPFRILRTENDKENVIINVNISFFLFSREINETLFFREREYNNYMQQLIKFWKKKVYIYFFVFGLQNKFVSFLKSRIQRNENYNFIALSCQLSRIIRKMGKSGERMEEKS